MIQLVNDLKPVEGNMCKLICPNCNKEFDKNYHFRKFCSDICREENRIKECHAKWVNKKPKDYKNSGFRKNPLYCLSKQEFGY